MMIQNTLNSFKWNCNNRTGYRKNVVIELPLSLHGFCQYFLQNIPKLETYFMNNQCSMKVSVSDLAPVFGNTWHIVHNENTTTTQRIFGMISMVFRQKTMTVCGSIATR